MFMPIPSAAAKVTVAAYVGPGDLVSGALRWYGLRAYSNAKIGSNCVRIRRVSDDDERDFVTLSTGKLDVANIATYLTATSGKIVKLYDQGSHAQEAAQTTKANQPAFTDSAIGALPGATFGGSHSLTNTNIPSQVAQPWTISFVAKRTSGTGGAVIGIGSSGIIVLGFGAANKINMYAGTNVDVNGNDSTTHAVQGVANGASSVLYVDGVSNSINPNTRSLWSDLAGMTIGNQFFGSPFNGIFHEVGVWSGAFTGTQQANMDNNQRTFWGF